MTESLQRVTTETIDGALAFVASDVICRTHSGQSTDTTNWTSGDVSMEVAATTRADR